MFIGIFQKTGALKLGTHTGQIVSGHIYSGGIVIFTFLLYLSVGQTVDT